VFLPFQLASLLLPIIVVAVLLHLRLVHRLYIAEE
jgi:hypothetical protein